MTYVSEDNIDRTLNSPSPPTRIILHTIAVTSGYWSKILHKQLSSLRLGYGISFSASEKNSKCTADEFFAEVAKSEQLEGLSIWDHRLKPSMKHLAYRSPVSLSLKKLYLASVAECSFLSVAQFCKAVCLVSRLDNLTIEQVNHEKYITRFGCFLFETGMSPLRRLALRVWSWQSLMMVFHKVESGKRRVELMLQKLLIVSSRNIDIGPVVAQLLRYKRLHTINGDFTFYSEQDKECNKFWSQVCGLETNLK